MSCVCVCTKKVCVKFTEPKVCTVGIYSNKKIGICQHCKPNFHAKIIICLKFTKNYSLFKLNHNLFCNFLDCNHIVCLYQKSVCKEYRTRLQSSATAFHLPDLRHLLSLYSYYLVKSFSVTNLFSCRTDSFEISL